MRFFLDKSDQFAISSTGPTSHPPHSSGPMRPAAPCGFAAVDNVLFLHSAFPFPNFSFLPSPSRAPTRKSNFLAKALDCSKNSTSCEMENHVIRNNGRSMEGRCLETLK